MQLRAPAKINLSFRILGRRPDGFHEIETLMAPVSLFDVITVIPKRGGGIEFVCDDPSLPRGADNLVVKAAQLFREAANIDTGFAIELQKNIPHGAGLGGGSSDAATVLLGLNRQLDAPLSIERLTEIAARLGSDVPFFLYEAPARCGGRGELVEPVDSVGQLRLLLLKPPFGVPTPWAYSRWRDSRELPAVDYTLREFRGVTFRNDLERPAFEKFLFLAQMKTWLREQPEVGAAMMSGSGATVFAVLREGAGADELATRAKAELDPELWTCACETLDPSTVGEAVSFPSL
jgi:4-diphosphocytidyl-2-C-methyl-D-erythritol kinase